jgi:hypothetical protein
MAEAAPDHIRLDYIFQKLRDRNISPFKARELLLGCLRTGELLVDQQIKTPTDRRKEEPVVDNIIEPVSPQAWGRTLDLVIDGHHLVVGFLGAFNYPWRYYSFSIANPAVVEELLDRIAPPSAADIERPRPPDDATQPILIAWAYGEGLRTGELIGLRGKKLRDKVFSKISPDFSTSERTFDTGVAEYKRQQTARR